MALGWISNHYSYYNDYWGLNRDGWAEHQLLRSDPQEFIRNIFYSPYDHYGGFFNSVGSYWNDLKNNLILKLLALFDFFSRGNYYINSLFFNCFGFFAHIAFYRVFIHLFPGKKWQAVIGCFLLPSTLYFSSGIHKDLIVFTMLGLYCYSLYFSLQHRFTPKRVFFLLVAMLAILLTRNFLLIALIPASFALVLSQKRKWNPILCFSGVYAIGITFLLLLQWAIPAFEPLKIITQKQYDFLQLPAAASQLPMQTLQPDAISIFKQIPIAFNHGFLRPYLWEPAGRFSFFFALEIIIYLFLLLLLVLRKDDRHSFNRPFLLFAIFFAVSMIIITGLIIPNSSSIVRYKSLYLPLLITPILCCIRWPLTIRKHINI